MAHTHNDAQNINDAGQTTGEDDGNDKKMPKTRPTTCIGFGMSFLLIYYYFNWFFYF